MPGRFDDAMIEALEKRYGQAKKQIPCAEEGAVFNGISSLKYSPISFN